MYTNFLEKKMVMYKIDRRGGGSKNRSLGRTRIANIMKICKIDQNSSIIIGIQIFLNNNVAATIPISRIQPIFSALFNNKF